MARTNYSYEKRKRELEKKKKKEEKLRKKQQKKLNPDLPDNEEAGTDEEDEQD